MPPFMSFRLFMKHCEHISAPPESSSGFVCDATVVRDAQPHGQAHTSPQKRGFLRSGRLVCAALYGSAPHPFVLATVLTRFFTRALARVWSRFIGAVCF